MSHFNVSLIVWAKSQDSVHKPQFLKTKETRSGSNRVPSAYQPSTLPPGHTGSQIRIATRMLEIATRPTPLIKTRLKMVLPMLMKIVIPTKILMILPMTTTTRTTATTATTATTTREKKKKKIIVVAATMTITMTTTASMVMMIR